jgi:hypothetical protein
MRSARSAPDAIHHTPGPNRAVPRLTSVGTPDPKALRTRFDGATSISASPAVHLLRADSADAADPTT